MKIFKPLPRKRNNEFFKAPSIITVKFVFPKSIFYFFCFLSIFIFFALYFNDYFAELHETVLQFTFKSVIDSPYSSTMMNTLDLQISPTFVKSRIPDLDPEQHTLVDIRIVTTFSTSDFDTNTTSGSIRKYISDYCVNKFLEQQRYK